jgi:hypothetical protein
VITSAEKPPLELCEALKLGYVYINTQKAPRRRDWERDDDLDSEDDWLEVMRDKNDATARAMMAVAVSRAAEERARWEIMEMKLEMEKSRALLELERKARSTRKKLREEERQVAEEKARWEMKLEKAKERALSKTEEKAEEREELEGEEK